MPPRTKPLTDIQVKNTKNSGTKEIKKFDGGGLYLRIDTNNNKGWRFKFMFNGKEKRMSFGSYPAVSLSDARQMRLNARKLLSKGINPIEFKRSKAATLEQARANTFKKIALEWHENRADLSPSTKKLHINRLNRDIFPAIGDRPISEITPNEVLEKVLRPMEARGVGEMTARVKSIISQIFSYAVSSDYTHKNVTTDLSGALKKVVKKHRAAITDPTDLAKLLRSIDTYDGYIVVKYALQLLPLIFVRPGELRAMKWSEINFDTAEWRYTISKTKSEHIVPLSRQSLDILRSIRDVTGSLQLVFPSVRSTQRPISDNTLNAALRRMGYSKEEVSAHGFRATARTLLDEVLEARIEHIEHQLAHNVKDTLGRAYNRTKHLEQRHTMMQQWADYLDGLKAGAKIIPLHQASEQN